MNRSPKNANNSKCAHRGARATGQQIHAIGACGTRDIVRRITFRADDDHSACEQRGRVNEFAENRRRNRIFERTVEHERSEHAMIAFAVDGAQRNALFARASPPFIRLTGRVAEYGVRWNPRCARETKKDCVRSKQNCLLFSLTGIKTTTSPHTTP